MAGPTAQSDVGPCATALLLRRIGGLSLGAQLPITAATGSLFACDGLLDATIDRSDARNGYYHCYDAAKNSYVLE